MLSGGLIDHIDLYSPLGHAICGQVPHQAEEEEMCKGKAPAKLLACWSRYIIGAVLLIGSSASAQLAGRTAQIERAPSHAITSGSIKVSIIGNQVHIETATPVVVDIKPRGEMPEAKLEPDKPREKVRLGWGGPIIIAPTP